MCADRGWGGVVVQTYTDKRSTTVREMQHRFGHRKHKDRKERLVTSHSAQSSSLIAVWKPEVQRNTFYGIFVTC